MKHIAILLIVCMALVACGRSNPEDLKVAAAQDQAAEIYDIVVGQDWSHFIDVAISSQDRGRLLKDMSPEKAAETLAVKDMSQIEAILAQMIEAEPYLYTAEGDEQVAFPLPTPVGDTEVVTMKLDENTGGWCLYQSRKK